MNRAKFYSIPLLVVITFSGSLLSGMKRSSSAPNLGNTAHHVLSQIVANQEALARGMGMNVSPEGQISAPDATWMSRYSQHPLAVYAVSAIMSIVLGQGIHILGHGVNWARDRINPEEAQPRREHIQRKIEFSHLNNNLTLLQSQLDKCDKDKKPELVQKFIDDIEAIRPRWDELHQKIRERQIKKALVSA